MKKGEIQSRLKEYKYALEWVELYSDKSQEDMGMSYSHSNTTKTNAVNSKVENTVVQKDEKWEEYQEKKNYIEKINRVLNKLPEDQRKVIEHEFNIIDDDYYSKFPVGEIPHADLVANSPFSRREFYRQRDKAYQLLEKYITAVL